MFAENKQHLWISIVLRDGVVIVGIFVNAPSQANIAMLAAKSKKNLNPFLDELKPRKMVRFEHIETLKNKKSIVA